MKIQLWQISKGKKGAMGRQEVIWPWATYGQE